MTLRPLLVAIIAILFVVWSPPCAFAARILNQNGENVEAPNEGNISECQYTQINAMMMEITHELCPDAALGMDCPWRDGAFTVEDCKAFCDKHPNCMAFYFNGRPDATEQRCQLTSGQYRLARSALGKSIGVKWPPPGGVCGDPQSLGPEFMQDFVRPSDQSGETTNNPGRH